MSDWSDEVTAKMVVFHTASTPFEARVVAGVLDDAGVPHFVEGGALADEFAATQRLMNLQSVTIRVPETHATLAKEALERAREAGAMLEGEDGVELEPEQPGEPVETPVPSSEAESASGRGPGLALFAFVGWFGAIVLFVMWMDLRTARAAPAADPNFRIVDEAGREVWYRRDTSVVQFVNTYDRAGRLVETQGRDREGRPVTRMFDENGDGFAEKLQMQGIDGEVVSTSFDDAQDGRWERTVESLGRGRGARYLHDPSTGLAHRLELLRDGTVVKEQRFDPDSGWVDVER